MTYQESKTYQELYKKCTAIEDALRKFDGTRFEIGKCDGKFYLYINGQIALEANDLHEIKTFVQGAEWVVNLLVGIKKE